MNYCLASVRPGFFHPRAPSGARIAVLCASGTSPVISDIPLEIRVELLVSVDFPRLGNRKSCSANMCVCVCLLCVLFGVCVCLCVCAQMGEMLLLSSPQLTLALG